MDPSHIPYRLSGTSHASAEAAFAADVRWLRAFAAQIVRDPQLADDACQEAWLGALKGGRSSTEREDLARRAWRFLSRHWRGEGRRRVREQEAASRDSTSSVDELLVQNEQQQRLWDELARLDEPYRSTLLLRFQGELSTQEIAARMEVRTDTVRWRIREGLSLMRQRLAADERGGGLAAIALVAGPSGAPLKPQLAAAQGTAMSVASLGALIMTKKIVACALVFIALATTVVLQFATPQRATELAVVSDPEGALVPVLREPAVSSPVQRMAVENLGAEQAEVLAAVGKPPGESLQAAILRLDLRAVGGAHLPATVTVSVMPYVEGGFVHQEVEQIVSTEGDSIELLLGLDLEGLKYMHRLGEITMGTVRVSAEGFGKQSSGLVSVGWNPGDITDLTMELCPATTTRISCVMPVSGDPVKNVKIVVDGPSTLFRHHYGSKDTSPITLKLVTNDEVDDRLYITGDGIALATISRTELLDLPVQGGLRRIEVSSGCRLEGTVEMASGLPVPGGSELAYTEYRRDPDGAALDYPVLIHTDGRVPIARDGWFRIEGLSEGIVRLHLREEGRMRFSTGRLSHDFDVTIPAASGTDFRIVIPEEQWKLTLALTWARQGPFGSSTLLTAKLYRAKGEDDLPYSRDRGSRQLIATSDLISQGTPGDIVLPAGLIEEGTPYILAISATRHHHIERRIYFEGQSPKIELKLAKESRLELGLPTPPAESDVEGRAAAIQVARDRGAEIVLRASTAR